MRLGAQLGRGVEVKLQGLLEEGGGSPEAGPSWQKKMEFCTGEPSKLRSQKVWACVCNSAHSGGLGEVGAAQCGFS